MTPVDYASDPERVSAPDWKPDYSEASLAVERTTLGHTQRWIYLIGPKEWTTQMMAAAFLGVAKSTVWTWRQEGGLGPKHPDIEITGRDLVSFEGIAKKCHELDELDPQRKVERKRRRKQLGW